MLGKRKRSLQLEPQQKGSLRQILAEQIDLEIALKTRLSAAAHARVEWTNILRNSLLESDASSAMPVHPPAAYRDAALAAYDAIEAQCQVISSRNSSSPSQLILGRRQILPAALTAEAPRTRKRAILGLAHGTFTGPILFEDRSSSISVTLKLVCTDCDRCDFSTMQGFLNHCRLAHSRVYGTHDECIQATGVVVDDNEREALLASGVEINTVHLPSLKGMFERAVGVASTNASAPPGVVNPCQSVEESSGPSTHLSKTLGLHKDTPTLAPFLGKMVKKKQINVYEVLDSIDVTSLDEELQRKQPSRCIKRRSKRSAGDEWTLYMGALAIERTGNIEIPHHTLPESSDSQASRFHVTRRILVSDRSLYLSETRRPSTATSHTHRWQICVSTPSYGQHITAFMSRLTVVCATYPPVFSSPIVVSEAPFIASSTTDRPFLARLTLEWVGTQNQPFEVDHWVELDQLRVARPILGEEQMFDVELDRNTVFLPVRDLGNAVSWSGDADFGMPDVAITTVPEVLDPQSVITFNVPNVSEPEHIALLKSIVARFPMTIQDLGACQLPTLPYVLYPSRGKLLGLTPGRRKAIEWNRALAIRMEYDSVSSTSGDHVSLTTADVYRWLDSQGQFPRPRTHIGNLPAPRQSKRQSSTASLMERKLAASPHFCPVCGVDAQCHTPGVVVGAHGQDASGIAGHQCHAGLERRWAPIAHVFALFTPSGMHHWAINSHHVNITSGDARNLVTVANPQLIRLVRREVSSLHLSCFKHGMNSFSGLPINDALSLGMSRREVDEALSTHALLAITLEKLVRDLVHSALQIAREMQSRTAVVSDETRETASKSLLTPTHVLQGLLPKDADLGGPKEALFKCFARVGTLLNVGGITQPPRSHIPPVEQGGTNATNK